MMEYGYDQNELTFGNDKSQKHLPLSDAVGSPTLTFQALGNQIQKGPYDYEEQVNFYYDILEKEFAEDAEENVHDGLAQLMSDSQIPQQSEIVGDDLDV